MSNAELLCHALIARGKWTKEVCESCRKVKRRLCSIRLERVNEVNNILEKDISALNKCIDEGRFNPRVMGGVR